MTRDVTWPCPEDGLEGTYTVEGSVSYDPGTPRSYASGGSPGGWELDDLRVTDWDGRDVTEQMAADEAFVAHVTDLLVADAAREVLARREKEGA